MLCFPNIVYVIFVRTVSFRNFHLNHGHILAWFLKEQEAHFNENITLPVIKIMISCFFDKFRDIILIVFIFLFFFYKESKLSIQQMLYFVPTFFWETHFALQRTDWLILHVIEAPLNLSLFLKRVLSAVASHGFGPPPKMVASGCFFLIKTGLLFI